jgi:hypothetical protein
MGLDGAEIDAGGELRGSRVQSPLVALDLVPVSRTMSLRVMVTLLWVKTALQP